MIVPRDLTPEDREELQNMLSICDIYPHRRVVFFAELLKLRAVADAMKRHPRQQHPAVQRAIEALPKYRTASASSAWTNRIRRVSKPASR